MTDFETFYKSTSKSYSITVMRVFVISYSLHLIYSIPYEIVLHIPHVYLRYIMAFGPHQCLGGQSSFQLVTLLVGKALSGPCRL